MNASEYNNTTHIQRAPTLLQLELQPDERERAELLPSRYSMKRRTLDFRPDVLVDCLSLVLYKGPCCKPSVFRETRTSAFLANV